ncbi:hypothetical protein CDLVIII_5327 [Clostridium sp. DL-VIII]|uniref:DUF4250 domain-containing protein n=1 Tax=Clostridium sp. DL-VIII TaxID=641107 RepID=UPI00023B034C|nr:DUF4250 domain-containing protein [Clostridium sp. DL-VIII]EHJ01809.1 hypothetical protein CDLVIII_5327 [Clostridium sp. DL-VIII]
MDNDSIKIMDPIILLSMVNMKLRDQYSSLELLCSDLELNKEDIVSRLGEVGYSYVEKENQFK